MLKKIKNKLSNALYGFIYSMKGGEELSSSNSAIDGANSSIEQKISQTRLSQDLLKGELTQQVEELRYRDYKVYEESKNYKYIGNGVAVKVSNEKDFNGRIKFSMSNKLVCDGVLEALDNLDETNVERYTLKVKYNNIPRFRLERHCTHFRVDISDKNSYIYLFFNTSPNANDVTSRQFTNELARIQEKKPTSELLTNANEIKFVTYNNSVERDYVEYTLTNLTIDNWGTKDGFYYLCFKIDYERVDLTEKFESKEMKEKYDTKAPKEFRSDVKRVDENNIMDSENEYSRNYTCEECGEKVKDFIGISSLESVGKLLCEKCWVKYLS